MLGLVQCPFSLGRGVAALQPQKAENSLPGWGWIFAQPAQSSNTAQKCTCQAPRVTQHRAWPCPTGDVDLPNKTRKNRSSPDIQRHKHLQGRKAQIFWKSCIFGESLKENSIILCDSTLSGEPSACLDLQKGNFQKTRQPKDLFRLHRLAEFLREGLGSHWSSWSLSGNSGGLLRSGLGITETEN